MVKLLALLFAALAAAQRTVTIKNGIISGVQCAFANANSYLGIPYAEPPVGELRFASPKPRAGAFPGGHWNGSTNGPSCMQADFMGAEPLPHSEDCLILNVFVPARANAQSKLPVKVWIHGGGFQTGGIVNPLYDMCELAHDAVIVTIQYRLGALGFLAMPEAGIQGNQAVEDTVLALRWVQENIEAFRGDRSKVLVFGESAGASMVNIVSSLPYAQSLMRAAIAQSGGGNTLPNAEALKPGSAAYAASNNCSTSDVGGLFALKASNCSYKGSTSGPHVDGTIIPAQPRDVGSRVPYIAGTTRNEWSFYLFPSIKDVYALNASDYESSLKTTFGRYWKQVEALFPLSLYAISSTPVYDAMEAVGTANGFTCGARRSVKATNDNGVHAWLYRFDRVAPCTAISGTTAEQMPFLKAHHAIDVAYSSAQLGRLPRPNGICKMAPADQVISDTLVTAWTSMASQGNPHGGKSVVGGAWPVFDQAKSVGLFFNAPPSVEFMPLEYCDLFDRLDPILNSGIFNATEDLRKNGNNGTGPVIAGAGRAEAYGLFTMISLLVMMAVQWL